VWVNPQETSVITLLLDREALHLVALAVQIYLFPPLK
jgi:hypothetical protein